MTVGQMGMPHPSLAGMVAAIDARISRVALHRRFSETAVAFLLHCLRVVLQQKLNQAWPLNTSLLRRFRRVMIADSSSWDVHAILREVLPGSGGAASSANCKLQAVYDYTHGELGFLDVTAGTVPDNRYTDQLPGMLHKGDLLLIDQGYFKLKTFEALIRKDAFFLTRFLVRTNLKDACTHQPIDLVQRLSTLPGNAGELQVTMGDEKGGKASCRLIALRISEQVANERRRRLRKAANKKGRGLSPRHLHLCDWTVLITNVPADWLPVDMVRALYTLRWQIELLFKQLKSILRIHQSETTKAPRLRCELYGKLIVAVMIHRIHAAANSRFWNGQQREVSMAKLYTRLQERAFSLLRHLLHSTEQAVAYLYTELERLLPSCLKGRQRSRMTTLEMLEAQRDPALDIDIVDGSPKRQVA